jgi:MoaA/NifB/PqqE/SkfB family radical SAM enzyme
MSVGILENIDIFQAEFPGYGLTAALASQTIGKWRGWKGGRRPISSIVQHNIEWLRLEEFGVSSNWIRRLELLCLNAVDEIITVSADDKNRLCSVGIKPSKVTVIPHGVDLKPYHAARKRRLELRDRYGLQPDTPLLIFHGTLHYWPNTEAIRFIAERLIPILLPEYPHLKILICGMNPPQYYAHPAIIFTGVVDDLPEHISAADVAICPLFAGGGTRLKLLEYMAAGLAIVSTTKGAEGIPHEGRIQIADTAKEMSKKIIDLLENKSQREKYGQAANQYVQFLSWAKVTEAYVHLYNGLHKGVNWYERLHQNSTLSVGSFLGNRKPSKPLTLLLMINRGCNLRCSFCDLWSGNKRLSLKELHPILLDAVSIGTKVLVITGGEPFLHPELFDIVRYAKTLGLSVNITTNGTLVEKNWDKLVHSGVDSVSFSIDGLLETHEKIRGKKGCFDQTVSAIKRVQNETKIDTSIYFVATNANVHELIPVYKLSKELDARFDFWPVNDAPEMAINTVEEQQYWRDAVALISKAEPDVAKRSQFYKDAMSYHAGALDGQSLRCLGLVDQYGIDYEGNLIPCCVWEKEGLIIGNVMEKPLREWWVDPKVQNARHQLVDTGCDAGCFNHSLYEFTDSTGLSFVVEKTDSPEAFEIG